MKVRKFLLFQTKAFTFFEIILLLVIMGILLLGAIPSLKIEDKLCFYHLRSKLAKANDSFPSLYSQNILHSQKVEVSWILKELTEKEKNHCYFEYKNRSLFAHIGKKTLKFTLSPADFKSKPKIYCSLSNEMCRIFWGKTLKK